MHGNHGFQNTTAILILAGLACLAACSTTTPAPRMPEPPPPALPVDGDALSAIAFDEVQLEIPDHLAVGYRYEGLDRSRTAAVIWGPEFRAGRPALDDDLRASLDGAGYRLDADDPRAVRLVARMVKVSIDAYVYKASYEQASCEMVWELWREGESRPYFTSTTTGGGRSDQIGQGTVLKAFDAALHRLLADAEFVAALRPGGAEG